MIFVDKIDIFLFYEDNTPKEVYLNAKLLNKQLKSLLNSDEIVYNNILYLDNIFNTLNENKPKEMIDNTIEYYNELTPTENSKEYKSIFTDFGTIKHWIDDKNYTEG